MNFLPSPKIGLDISPGSAHEALKSPQTRHHHAFLAEVTVELGRTDSANPSRRASILHGPQETPKLWCAPANGVGSYLWERGASA